MGPGQKYVQKQVHKCYPVMLSVAPDSGMKIPSCLRQSQAQIQEPCLLNSPAK